MVILVLHKIGVTIDETECDAPIAADFDRPGLFDAQGPSPFQTSGAETVPARTWVMAVAIMSATLNR